LSPSFDVALAEHREQARWLAEAGADLLMVETMPLAAEAEAAVIAARETGLEVTVGFVVGADSRLLSGESLADVIPRVERHGVSAILINCAPIAAIGEALRSLARSTELPIGGYANLGVVDPLVGWASNETIDGTTYADAARDWIENGAQLIGGCCGTRPEHIAALRQLRDGRNESAQ